MGEGDDTDDADDSLPLRELSRLRGGTCVACGVTYSARAAVGSVALGFKNAPRCFPCLAHGLHRDPADLSAGLLDYVRRRECYLKAWREAERLDGVATQVGSGSADTPPSRLADEPASLPPDDTWDAGDIGCGELVMALRLRMKKLPSGGVIRVTATDPAAPEDLPAWCRLTGHTLAYAAHPHYLIRRQGA